MRKTALLIIICIITTIFANVTRVNADSSVSTNLTITLKVADVMSYVSLDWNTDTSSTNYYKVQRKAGNDEYEDLGGYNNAIDNSYSDIMTYPQIGTSFSYRIAIYDSNYNLKSYSNIVSFVLKYSGEPTNFKVTTISNNKIALSWEFLHEAPLSTTIERKVEDTDDETVDNVWVQIGGTNGNTSYFEDPNISQDKVYTYRVRSIYGANCYSPYVEALSIRSELLKPSIFTVSLLNKYSALIEWSNTWSQDINVYVDRKKNNEEFSNVLFATNSEGAYLDDTIVPGNTYTYRIRAQGRYSGTYSPYSDEITIIPIDLPAPSGLSPVATSNTTIDLSWQDNSNDESGFEIWRRNGDGTAWVKYTVVSANVRIFNDKNLSPATLYSYKIRAFSTMANVSSTFTAEMSATTIVPTANIVLDYSCVYNIPTLRWDVIGSLDNESMFQLERRGEYDLTWSALPAISPSSKTYTDSILTPYTRYSYRMKVINTVNNSAAYSNTLEFATGEPKSPTDLDESALGSNTVKLSWKDGSMNEDGFIIERCVDSLGYIQVAKVPSGQTSYIDNLLSPGKVYTFRVSAYNKSGISGYTNEKYFTSRSPTIFYDMANSSWAIEAVLNLADIGIVKGTTQENFSPDQYINRSEFTSMVVRALKLKQLHSTNFNDVKPADWYYEDVLTAKAYGIISGIDGYFNPESPVTREDTAVILCKALEAVSKPLAGKDSSILDNYADRASISEYAISFLSSMRAEGLMNGKDGNRLAPKDYLSRAEAATIIWRVISNKAL